jgi:hypothetical protein
LREDRVTRNKKAAVLTNFQPRGVYKFLFFVRVMGAGIYERSDLQIFLHRVNE